MFFLYRVLILIITLLIFGGCNQNRLKVAETKGLNIASNLSDSSSSNSSGGKIKGKVSRDEDIKKEAIVVGISDYAPLDRNDLDGIEKDVSKMKKLFEKWGFRVRILYDADSMKILDYLDKYSKELDSNDYFAFYYSGHGSFKSDDNGDEIDNKDETLVLSDGNINKHLPDDILYEKFNKIKAKKMIFLDSCHSGTAFRALNLNAKPKSISPDEVTATFKEPVKMRDVSAVRGSERDFIEGEYIVFSASQDNEESLATPTGSLFTNAIYKTFTDENYLNKPLKSIKDVLTKDVLKYAKETKNTPHHPNISFSELTLSSKSLDDFLNMKPKGSQNVVHNVQDSSNLSTNTDSKNRSALEKTLDDLILSNRVDKMKLSYDKSSYKEGEPVFFVLDTGNKRGFLTIFYIDGSDVTILYPNPYISSNDKIGGKYKFPEDLSNGKFELEAYKSCKGCESERTVIYTLLTSEPVTDINQIKSKELFSFSKESEDEKKLTRAVRLKATSSENFKPELGKYEFIVK